MAWHDRGPPTYSKQNDQISILNMACIYILYLSTQLYMYMHMHMRHMHMHINKDT